ncbi:hypothetical protein [Sediminicoccus sp. KRV36]|uniref:hypothetical protein n=1 Tax=Sediminicoccus sp. KRV36 TaxID=3133721 RepID=UPI00200C12D9|nr:hypothetical protein [Sediminicoccus rosea]UPY37654.1 hypothetical protein LHU95_02885 [Sediminicoccus rosea]
MRCIPLIAFALSAVTAPAAAQQRVVVVPAGAEIVIPPRGAEGPSLVRAPRPRIPGPGQPMTRPMLETSGAAGGLGLAAPALIALPLIAAAYLAGSVPGSSSSTSAPARTR